MFNHKQRLSVLLASACLFYSILYLSYYTLNNLSYLLDIDLMVISTSVISVSLILDKISLGFSALVTFISACVFFFARSYMSSDLFYFRFMWILLSFVLSMNMLILSGSFVMLLVGWDGLGISSFALIIYYQSKDSLVAGFLTLLINRVGDIIIMSMFFFFALSGMTFLFNYPSNFQYYMLFLLALGALTKSAQYPFSVWLPAAMAAPTPVSALVHSSTLVTAGIYIIIRAVVSMDLPAETMSVLLFCGSVTSFLGGVCALVENDIKKIIALSTLSQLGVMVFSLGLGSCSLALLHLYTHAMFKALLFLVAGAILMLSFGVQDIRLLGAVTRKAPLLLVFMNISAFCLMGLPFLSAFYSKHVILGLMWVSYSNMLSIIMMLLSTGFTGLYMIRLLKCMNWSQQSSPLVQPTSSLLFYMPMCFLLFGSLTCGLLLTNLDVSLPLNLYLPSGNDVLLNLITGIGVLVGCMIVNRHKAPALTNMAYLSPLWYNSTTMYHKISTKMKYLDQGWLEPQSASITLIHSSNKMVTLMSWPSSSMSFLPYTFLFLGTYTFTWFFLS